ncbi:CoA-transferase family III domain-containing protein [Epithele typhae]|uniref:CoA-transferase family III domain-containing protein n=1 Tax=Epithele typhae TaxID=378194 RepID=UPI002007B531|nr:CoA-transferase family III domain-containing protein [Epithele typhae]KAH9924639.1 CoA-transferase family III domain-containing protein [Epithele typhae]
MSHRVRLIWRLDPRIAAPARAAPALPAALIHADLDQAPGSHLIPHPLQGIRVLDLTRVLAGPVCGRTLAAHGADVLWITSPSLPALPLLDIDTSRGKRTTQLDLNATKDREQLSYLIHDSDVFLQAYHPGGLANKGFGVEDAARARPGIVYASLTAYDWDGPWKERRGFDSLVQTATGFNVAEAEAYAAFTGAEFEPPRPLPMQALDHAAGYLLAFGIQAALCKTITEGGSWEVRVSLAAVAQWIAFGEGRPLPPRSMDDEELSRIVVEIPVISAQGEPQKAMKAIRHSAVLSATPVQEGEAPMRLDSHPPQWLPRM